MPCDGAHDHVAVQTALSLLVCRLVCLSTKGTKGEAGSSKTNVRRMLACYKNAQHANVEFKSRPMTNLLALMSASLGLLHAQRCMRGYNISAAENMSATLTSGP